MDALPLPEPGLASRFPPSQTDAPTGTLASAPASAPGRQPAARPLLIAHLRGTQADMGQQHGALLAAQGGYQAALRYYPRMPERMLLADQTLGHAALRPVVEWALWRLAREQPAAYRERAHAFLAALGLPAGMRRHLFVMDVLQNLIALAGRMGLGPSRALAAAAAVPACSSLAVWGQASADGTLLHARNFDFPGVGIWEQQPMVVFCTPESGLRHGFVTTRGADTPGITAFNEAGLSLTVHTCLHRDVRFAGAGIVDLGHELIRRAETLADAVRIARERPAASSWSLLISSARERTAVVLELAGPRLEVRWPQPGEPFLAQTNRYRCPALQPGEVAPSAGFLANSEGRYLLLRRHARASLARGGMSLADLQALLGSHEDPDVPGHERATGGMLGQGISVQSVIFAPEMRALHFSLGDCPTGHGPYAAVPWSWDEPVGVRVVAPEVVIPETAGSAAGPPGSRFAHGPGLAGLRAYVDAIRLQGAGAGAQQVARALERAVALDPAEPGYRLLAGAYRLRDRDLAGALAHFRHGLAHERAPFPRGQLLYWAARTARAAGRDDEARALTQELLAQDEPQVLDLQTRARREARTHRQTRIGRTLDQRRLGWIAVNTILPDVIDMMG